MKKFLTILLIMNLCGLYVFSQKQRKEILKNKIIKKKKKVILDLNGTWELDYSNTKLDKLTKAFHTKIENFSKTLFVEQKQNTIKVKEVTNWDWLDKKSKLINSSEVIKTYNTNDKGEINTVEVEKYRTKTKWFNDKLVITHLTDGKFTKIEPYGISEVVLSKDKNTLIWHFKFIGNSKKEEEELRELETYLVFIRKK